jgi:hypothetical protein
LGLIIRASPLGLIIRASPLGLIIRASPLGLIIRASPLGLIIRAFNSLGFCKRALDRIIHWTTDNSGNTILLGTEKFDNTQVNKFP